MELNLNDFVEGNEEEVVEVETKLAYDRCLYCADTNRITELVKNVFVPVIRVDSNNEEIVFYESNDNYIKWDTKAMDLQQLQIIEGLLAHRKQVGLLADMYTDEMEKPLMTVNTNAPLLQGCVYLGGLKDEKQVNMILDKVVRVANIPVEDNDKILIFKEAMSANMPQAETFVLLLTDLTPEEMINLKRSSKVKKTADKVNKVTNQINTVGFALTKTVVDDIGVKAMESTAKIGGAIIGGAVVGTFKGATTGVNEVLHSITQADLGNYAPYQEMKSNAKQLWKSFSKSGNNDSYSFNF